MRLFFAVNVPQEIKNELMKTIGQIQKLSIKGNFTREELLHITLVFLGEVNDPEKAIQVLKRLKGSKTTITIGGLGSFKRQGGDLIFAGVKTSSGLEHVQRQLSKLLKEQGFSLEDRPYRPHITLGREVMLSSQLPFDLPQMELPVTRISLMKSERIKGKLVYTEIVGKELEQ